MRIFHPVSAYAIMPMIIASEAVDGEPLPGPRTAPAAPPPVIVASRQPWKQALICDVSSVG